MRQAAVLMLLMILAVPLAAQASPAYQPPARQELDELRNQGISELKSIRAGTAQLVSGLSSEERARIETMLGGEIQSVQMLGGVKAGSHFHVHWGVWVAIPCTCGTVALLLLVLLLL